MNTALIERFEENMQHLGAIDNERHAQLAGQYFLHLLDGRRDEAMTTVIDAVKRHEISITDMYIDVFQPVLYEVGRLWEHNKLSVATEHYFTAATQLAMAQLFPFILENATYNQYVMVGCCVGGELHEVGMRMVSDFFQMEGWNTYFMGGNMPDEAIVTTLLEQKADLLCISVTMSFNTHLVKRLIEVVRNDPVARNTRIMVGGLPFSRNQLLAPTVGADLTATDARDAIVTAATAFGLD